MHLPWGRPQLVSEHTYYVPQTVHIVHGFPLSWKTRTDPLNLWKRALSFFHRGGEGGTGSPCSWALQCWSFLLTWWFTLCPSLPSLVMRTWFLWALWDRNSRGVLGYSLRPHEASWMPLEVNLTCREMCRQGRWEDCVTASFLPGPVLWRLTKVSGNPRVVETWGFPVLHLVV